MFAAVFTICVSLLLLSFFAILLINANSVVNSLREKVEMEAFLKGHIPGASNLIDNMTF